MYFDDERKDEEISIEKEPGFVDDGKSGMSAPKEEDASGFDKTIKINLKLKKQPPKPKKKIPSTRPSCFDEEKSETEVSESQLTKSQKELSYCTQKSKLNLLNNRGRSKGEKS